jgi:RNA polymerase sigma-70 factor (ECF subfamily)
VTDSSALAPEGEAKPSTPSAAPAGTAAGKPRAHAGKITEHGELLRDARSALAAGDAARALTLLDAHPEVGRGPLGPEWAAARILVLCRLGRVSEAKQLGQRFLKSHSSSPLAAQVAASCAAAQ